MIKATYIQHMGTDLTAVNAARVSFGKESRYLPDGHLSAADQRLIGFLARGCTSGDWNSILDDLVEAGHGARLHDNDVAEGMLEEDASSESWDDLIAIVQRIKTMPTHWTPFGHAQISIRVKAPIFLARQLGRHQVGFVWNEVSRRYVDDEPEFFFPDHLGWRARAENVKQGSSDQGVEEITVQDYGGAYKTDPGSAYSAYIENARMFYRSLIDSGVAPELARMALPQSMLTEWWWTGSLFAWANLFIQRSDSHAQLESQMFAAQVEDIIAPLFPVSWYALTR